MIILITGASHTGKTALSQKLLEKYIKIHFSDVKRYANVIEKRLDDSYCTLESVIEDNKKVLELAMKHKVNYILPEKQNWGFGTKLLQYALTQCKGVPTLWILENNKAAERLYCRMGFKATGRRHSILNGIDEIEFALL